MNKFVIILIVILFLISDNLTAQSGWIQQNGNTNKHLSEVFFVNEQKGWIVTDSSKILSTTNGGLTWSQRTLPYYTPLNTVYFINENTGWVSGSYYYFVHSGVTYKTTNGGNNWIFMSYSGGQSIYFTNESTGYLAVDGSGDFESGGGIAKTTNGGLNWEGDYSHYAFNSVTFKNTDTGFAVGLYWDDTGHDTSSVFRTTNSGSTWEIMFRYNSYPVYSNALKDICVKGNNVWASGRSGSIIFSSDNGNNWSSQILPSQCNSIFFIDESTGWTVGNGYSDTSGIYKTTDSGENWLKQRLNFTCWLHSVTFINNNTGWSAGEYGVILKTTNGGLTFAENNFSMSPASYYLSQNYPNPFNPVTNLEFGISELGFVSLKVYDVLGKVVRTLVNENKSAGYYNVEFDGIDLPSGVYFYRLEAGEFVETKRMLLIK